MSFFYIDMKSCEVFVLWQKQLYRLTTVRCDTMFVWWFDVVSLHSKISNKILKAVKADNLSCCDDVLTWNWLKRAA